MLADIKCRDAILEADYAAQRAYFKKFADIEAANGETQRRQHVAVQSPAKSNLKELYNAI